MLSSQELLREAAATGFQAEPLEKVVQLLDLLESLRSHPFLKERVVLKGGNCSELVHLQGTPPVGRHRFELHRRSGPRSDAQRAA